MQATLKTPRPKSRKPSGDSVGLPPAVPYTARITKACALIADTRNLLSHWDSSLPVKDNIDRIQRENIFGKASRSRVADILTIFRHRYLTDAQVTSALVALNRGKFPSAALDQILYFHSAEADRLLYDAVTRILVPLYERGQIEIHATEFQRLLEKLLVENNTRPWSQVTKIRASQCLLTTLRDFGVLQGVINKKIAPGFLPTEAFAYVAFYLSQHRPTPIKLAERPEWNLFLLSREGVERSLFEAHQLQLMEYYVAGSVTRLTFPVATLQEYANVLAQR